MEGKLPTPPVLVMPGETNGLSSSSSSESLSAIEPRLDLPPKPRRMRVGWEKNNRMQEFRLLKEVHAKRGDLFTHGKKAKVWEDVATAMGLKTDVVRHRFKSIFVDFKNRFAKLSKETTEDEALHALYAGEYGDKGREVVTILKEIAEIELRKKDRKDLREKYDAGGEDDLLQQVTIGTVGEKRPRLNVELLSELLDSRKRQKTEKPSDTEESDSTGSASSTSSDPMDCEPRRASYSATTTPTSQAGVRSTSHPTDLALPSGGSQGAKGADGEDSKLAVAALRLMKEQQLRVVTSIVQMVKEVKATNAAIKDNANNVIVSTRGSMNVVPDSPAAEAESANAPADSTMISPDGNVIATRSGSDTFRGIRCTWELRMELSSKPRPSKVSKDEVDK